VPIGEYRDALRNKSVGSFAWLLGEDSVHKESESGVALL
jgi:hypothetical protein